MKSAVLRSQANEVLELIQSVGLEPSSFAWGIRSSVETPGLEVSSLTHSGTGHYFIFDFCDGEHYAVHSPGRDSMRETRHTEFWSSQVGSVENWLQYLKREVQAPDLWSAILEDSQLATAAASSDDEQPFTVEEQRKVSSQLAEIKRYVIATHDLCEEDSRFVTKRLDYLADAAKRQARRDWLHLALGVLLTIGFKIGLGSEGLRELFSMVGAAVQDVVGGLLPSG